MANTYTQIYIHIVFAVQRRQNLILKEHKEELHKYITGIVRNKGQKLIAINSMPDHTHTFIGMKPAIALSDLVRDIKNNSSCFINDKKWIRGKFNWQKGFGAFSYGHSQIDAVVKYIQNQENHHAKKTFKEEYLDMLKKFQVEYEEKYLFEWVEALDEN
jgi:REP element-mobilizing transposase RayT